MIVYKKNTFCSIRHFFKNGFKSFKLLLVSVSNPDPGMNENKGYLQILISNKSFRIYNTACKMKTSQISVSNLDLDRIRIKSGQKTRIRIRIQEGKNDPQKLKKFRNLMSSSAECSLFFEGGRLLL